MLSSQPYLKSYARQLRRDMTCAEQLLWYHLRRKQLLNIQFYRQKPLFCYIVDFYAPAIQLVIELDGCQHFDEQHQQQDALRDATLAKHQLYVMRFDDRQVLTETESVVASVYAYAENFLQDKA